MSKKRVCDVCNQPIEGLAYQRVRWSVSLLLGSTYSGVDDVCGKCWKRLEKMAREESDA